MRIYAAHRDRLLVVEDDGESRAELQSPTIDERLEGRQLEDVAAHPSTPERAVVGTFDDGCYRTPDGGDSFESIGDAVEEPAVTAVAVAPHDPEVVWLGTEPSRLYRSIDGGRSFEPVDGLQDLPSAAEWSFPPRPDTHHVRWIEPDPADSQRCYVGVEAGALCYTTDGGETWHDRPPGSRRDNHQLATHPDAPGRVYSAAGDGYAVSTDGGEHWDAPQDGLEHRYVWSVCPDPTDPDRVLVSAASGPGDAHSPPGESYLYRRDGENPWKRLDCPLSGQGVLRAVLASGNAGGVLFGLNDRGLYVTRNCGDDWSRVDVDWPDALREQTARGLAVVPTTEASHD